MCGLVRYHMATISEVVVFWTIGGGAGQLLFAGYFLRQAFRFRGDVQSFLKGWVDMFLMLMPLDCVVSVPSLTPCLSPFPCRLFRGTERVHWAVLTSPLLALCEWGFHGLQRT